MEMALSIYQKDHRALDKEAPDYLDQVAAWYAEWTQAEGAMAREVAAVLLGATRHSLDLYGEGNEEAADALVASVDRVLDAVPASVLASFDALSPFTSSEGGVARCAS